MKLPQYKKKKNRTKLKICQELGCGKEYVGHVISKYCEIHRDITMRKRERKVYIDITNQQFMHTFKEIMTIEFKCLFKGCGSHFTVSVYPKQYVYPKYCEYHRNIYRREMNGRA